MFWRQPRALEPQSARPILLIFTEKIAHPDDSSDLFGGEPRQQIPPNRFRMNRAGGGQLFPAVCGKRHKNSFPIRRSALDECSFLHARQLMREAAFIPGHHSGKRLLAHLTLAYGCETRQNAKL